MATAKKGSDGRRKTKRPGKAVVGARVANVPAEPRPHERWVRPIFPGMHLSWGAKGSQVIRSHPLLDAIAAAEILARDHAASLAGDYALAHVLDAVGQIAGAALRREAVGAESLEALDRALKWARPVLRPDRPARGINADAPREALAGMVTYPPIERDDLAWDLLGVADRAERLALVRAEGFDAPIKPTNRDAWMTAKAEDIALEADGELRRAHHLLDVEPPSERDFRTRAAAQIEVVRKRSNESERTPINFVRALLRAWGLSQQAAKNATETLLGHARPHRRGLV